MFHRALSIALRLAIGIAIAWQPFVHAQLAGVPEYELKTAYLYHFLELAEWPAPKTDAPLQICIDNDNPWRAALIALNNRTVHDKPIRIGALSSDRYAQCQVLILKLNDLTQLNAIVSASAQLHALTISDDPAIDIEAVMINLQIDSGRVAFAINNTRARAAGITISSKLLRLASVVR